MGIEKGDSNFIKIGEFWIHPTNTNHKWLVKRHNKLRRYLEKLERIKNGE